MFLSQLNTQSSKPMLLNYNLPSINASLSSQKFNLKSCQSQFVKKDGEIERLRTEVGELHKSKRQLIEMVEQKDLVISEKNATIKSYLDKIVSCCKFII